MFKHPASLWLDWASCPFTVQQRLCLLGHETLPRPVYRDRTLIDSTSPSASACGLRATALELALAGVTLPVNRDHPAAGRDSHTARVMRQQLCTRNLIPIRSHSRAA